MSICFHYTEHFTVCKGQGKKCYVEIASHFSRKEKYFKAFSDFLSVLLILWQPDDEQSQGV